MNDAIFRGTIIGMFAIILGMAGYIVTNINKSSDASIMALQSQLDDSVHRMDRMLDRVNDIDQRLAASEARIIDLQMRH
jgi:K+/H+ antiporter YhaU regulatory subunit KhtT